MTILYQTHFIVFTIATRRMEDGLKTRQRTPLRLKCECALSAWIGTACYSCTGRCAGTRNGRAAFGEKTIDQSATQNARKCARTYWPRAIVMVRICVIAKTKKKKHYLILSNRFGSYFPANVESILLFLRSCIWTMRHANCQLISRSVSACASLYLCVSRRADENGER